jgi:hypothetical protein
MNCFGDEGGSCMGGGVTGVGMVGLASGWPRVDEGSVVVGRAVDVVSLRLSVSCGVGRDWNMG